MSLSDYLPPDLAARLPAPLPPPEIEPDDLDLESLKVVARLRRHGYAAYLVGGCVRDLLVGVHPKDWDVATSAHPEQIRDAFRNSRLIGRRFRLAHVFFPNGKIIEVATFRATPVAESEGEGGGDLLMTEDNLFGDAEEDAVRRDFTINALFYDVWDGRVIDYVGGRKDLDAKVVRTIGDPEIRLREDPVRGLRAARIAAKLGFTIDPATFDAMVRHADELPRCAPARVLEETLKVLRSGSARGAFELLHRAGILRVLVPPVHDLLETGGEETERQLLARLGALDTLVRREPVSDAVMLATVFGFLPLHARPGANEGPAFDEPTDDEPHATPSIDKALERMSQYARLPRRIADRVRSIHASQRLFLQSQKKKRRRGGTSGFVRTPHFAESLQLFEIDVLASGQHREVLARWVEKAAVHRAEIAQAPTGEISAESLEDEADRPAPPEPEPAAAEVETAEDQDESEEEAAPTGAPPSGNEPARKKKRRRGGRRHRKPKEGGEPGASQPPPSEGQPT